MTHILMIDDDELILENTLQLLEFEGYRVSGLADGTRALETIQKLCPDLILLDLRMPEIDGYTVMDKVRKNPTLAQIPIIILSAYADVESIERSLDAGAQEYLVKPYTDTELYHLIDVTLRHQDSGRYFR